jgi:HlyD family secretion protein
MRLAVRRSRHVLTIAALALVAGGLLFAFWPQPSIVDMAQVRRGEMRVTIDEQGRTRVRDAYVVSTPVAGRLLRVEVDPGDEVVRGQTVVAQMLPANPAALDVRTREQARASVAAAEAALRLAHAEFSKAVADKDFADEELARNNRLAEQGIASQASLDLARSGARKAAAAMDTAEAAIAMREAELANARAHLIGFDDRRLAAALDDSVSAEIPLTAPATGRILRIMQQSETTLAAGTQIMEIGNVEDDLEILVELLSTDAVQVRPGDRVIIANWGGDGDLEGKVERVDPFGFTKFSALGVEEQRVNTVIRFESGREKYRGLGHGFRVEVSIVIWENEDAVIVPSSSLFRIGGDWAVFVVADGYARQRKVEIGRNNGIDAQVLGGIEPEETVIVYPSSSIADGAKVARRRVE